MAIDEGVVRTVVQVKAKTVVVVQRNISEVAVVDVGCGDGSGDTARDDIVGEGKSIKVVEAAAIQLDTMAPVANLNALDGTAVGIAVHADACACARADNS
jgi:hypothetical protein